MLIYIEDYISYSPAGSIEARKEASFETIKTSENRYLSISEPSYEGILTPIQLRRMSKMIRVSTHGAKTRFQEEPPQSIHIGTALGMLVETADFIHQIVVHEESGLSPTAFIQSTHNTISGVIALALKCNGHNLTFAHKGHSFESAITDMRLQWTGKTERQTALLGCMDEVTDLSFRILQELNLEPQTYHVGEGVSIFKCSNEATENSIACISQYSTLVTEDTSKVAQWINQCLDKISRCEQVCLYWGGEEQEIPKNICTANKLSNPTFKIFKHFTGEYSTAIGAGLAMAVNDLQFLDVNQVIIINQLGNYWSFFELNKIKEP